MRLRSLISLACFVLTSFGTFSLKAAAQPLCYKESSLFYHSPGIYAKAHILDLTAILDHLGISEGSETRLMAFDVDRDGDLDLLVHTRSNGTEIWYNDGCGHFSKTPFSQVRSMTLSGGSIEPTECSSFLCQEPESLFFSSLSSVNVLCASRHLPSSTGFFLVGFSRPPPEAHITIS